MEQLSDILGTIGGICVGVAGTLVYAWATGQKVEWRRKLLLRTIAHTFTGSKTRPRTHA